MSVPASAPSAVRSPRPDAPEPPRHAFTPVDQPETSDHGGGVEGDSASSAELYAILSALSELPLRQDLAVTGSVNQHGEIQAIGAVNEKIEGFFDICRRRALTGTQGVLIPQANVQHLMLRRDVIDACAEGKFAIYPVNTIDEGIALLTGAPAGERSAGGCYPDGSVNRLVEDRLRSFARIRARSGSAPLARSRSYGSYSSCPPSYVPRRKIGPEV